MFRFVLFLPLLAHASPTLYDGSIPRKVLLKNAPATRSIPLTTPAPYITQAYFSEDPQRQALRIAFNADATEVALKIPENLRAMSGPITLEIAEKSVAFPDGQIIFSALDAKVEGPGRAKLESHPGNYRVGFWADLKDSVVWDFSPTTCGMYSVELSYSLAGKGSDIEVSLGGQVVKGSLASTGTWYEYTTQSLGRIYLADDKPTKLSVKGTKILGGAVMNLKAVTLRPAPEGDEPIAKPASDGKVTLMANQATVYGQKLRYEPQPKKLCIGYWTVPTDFVSWDLEVPAEGEYQVRIFQGCSNDNAGSPVDVLAGGEKVSFKVLATGHFQKFVPVDAGVVLLKKGANRIVVQPQGKVKTAVMDVQKIELIPVR